MADRAVDQLSGRRAASGCGWRRAWPRTPSVLLLDEPTNHLDLRYQVETLDLIRELADEHGTALGVVLHDLNQAASVADEVVLLDQGRVRAAGPPADVLTDGAPDRGLRAADRRRPPTRRPVSSASSRAANHHHRRR